MDDQDYVRYTRMLVLNNIFESVQAYWNDQDRKPTAAQKKLVGWLVKDGIDVTQVLRGKQKKIADALNTEGVYENREPPKMKPKGLRNQDG